jgi:TonB family protein
MNISLLIRRGSVLAGAVICLGLAFACNSFAQAVDLDDLAKRLNAEMQRAHVQTVIVGDFAGDGDRVTLQGVALADRLWFVLLQQDGAFKTLNRALLHGRLYARPSQPSFQQAQLDAAHAAGAEVLITGKIERRANELNVVVTAVRISGGKEVTQFNWVVPRTALLNSLDLQPIQPQGPVYVLGQDGVSTPSCVYFPYPEYSDAARKEKIEGTVVVEAMIDPSGRATKVWEVRGLPQGLSKQAVETVRRWHFKSAQGQDGRAVTVMVPIDVTFRLM